MVHGARRSTVVIPPERVELAMKIARGFVRRLPRSVQREDIEAAAMFGLFKALKKQPTGDGDSYEWFIRRRIRGAIIDELRHQDWLPRKRAGVDRPWRLVHLEDVTGPGGLPLELPANDWQPEEDIHRQRSLEQMWQTPMPERELRIMRACYGGKHGRLRLDVADEEHVSEARISQIAGRSIARMRDHLAAVQGERKR